MLDLSELTEGTARGLPPDVHSVLGYQSRPVRYHTLVGEEMAKKFGGKERMYLTRKIEQARQHIHGRRDLNLTGKDAEERAVQEATALHVEEINRMEDFELYRVFLKSLQTAFEHTRSIVSFLKRRGENPGE
jgi:hypothetical protein